LKTRPKQLLGSLPLDIAQFKQRPYFGGKIGGSGGGFRRVPVKIDTPDCALVAGERSDPVTSVTLAQHRLAIWKKKGDLSWSQNWCYDIWLNDTQL
jgi:hypothetical protein